MLLQRVSPAFFLQWDCDIIKEWKPAKISNMDVLNAALYVVENGCKRRSLPKEYGDWHVIYVRINRWAKKGVLGRVFLRLQHWGSFKSK
jgi:transposase